MIDSTATKAQASANESSIVSTSEELRAKSKLADNSSPKPGIEVGGRGKVSYSWCYLIHKVRLAAG